MVGAAWFIATMLIFPCLALAAELLLGAPRRVAPLPARVAPPFALLIPAHDEAAGIADTVAAASVQLRPGDRLVVIADNCGDATAALARAVGAEVIERSDPQRRGKSYALAFGRDYLRRDPRPVVLLMDADCRPGPGALARLALAAARGRAAVQGCYLLTPGEAASPLVRISCFAFLLKNLVRQRGLTRLGAPALLQGSGMAFPWPMFARAPLASGSLVEDLELGLDLALAGESVRFEESALFLSPASAQSATMSQRQRWEHGMIASGIARKLQLLGAALAGRPRLLPLFANLCVPPLALLVALLAGGAAVLAGAALASGAAGPMAALLLAALVLGIALVLAWRREGHGMLPAAMLVRLPAYLLWKMPLYARFLTRRQQHWVRTSRQP